MTERRKILHFTLGPVQGFIADARRTRDFWAGSFLLSWLSGSAMAALKQKDGTIIFPEISDDKLFAAIMDPSKGGQPYIGSLPNRFKAEITNVVGDAGEICRKEINKQWHLLTDRIYDHFLKGKVASKAKNGEAGLRAIWDRQIDHFWDTNWVCGLEEPDNGKWLDQRKNWRRSLKPDEGGDLCRLMGQFQELSGYRRLGKEKASQKEFWEYFSAQNGVGALNLRPDERLCAIALVKRLFPLIAEDVLGWNPGGKSIDIKHWPSVSYIAAVPWLERAAKLEPEQQSDYFKSAQGQLNCDFMGESHTRLFGLPKNGLFKLDGHLLHLDGIKSWNSDSLVGQDYTQKEKARNTLSRGLVEIHKKVGLQSASEFYAVLMMDGDRIGARLGSQEDLVKLGLANFTNAVRAYFDPKGSKKNAAKGTLIYAGGDDVLALVPVDYVITAAKQLRAEYESAFAKAHATLKGKGKPAEFTMSAAIIFTQYKVPLRTALSKSHHYLDNIAKNENGRDSLAIAVLKPGGITYDWVSCWYNEVDPVSVLEQVSREIAKPSSRYSSSFLYNVRERYAPLFYNEEPGEPDKRYEKKSQIAFGDPDLMRFTLAAEIKKQPGKGNLTDAQLDEHVAPLMTIGHPLQKDDCGIRKRSAYHFEGLLVARFIAEQIMNSDSGHPISEAEGNEE